MRKMSRRYLAVQPEEPLVPLGKRAGVFTGVLRRIHADGSCGKTDSEGDNTKITKSNRCRNKYKLFFPFHVLTIIPRDVGIE